MEASSKWRKRREAVKHSHPAHSYSCHSLLSFSPSSSSHCRSAALAPSFFTRASLGCSLPDEFLLSQQRFYQSDLPGKVLSLFVFPPCVKLVFPSGASLRAPRGNPITKVHVRIVLRRRDSCGRNSRLPSLFLPGCGYLKRRATTLGRPCWPPLCSPTEERPKDGAGQKPHTSIAWL